MATLTEETRLPNYDIIAAGGMIRENDLDDDDDDDDDDGDGDDDYNIIIPRAQWGALGKESIRRVAV